MQTFVVINHNDGASILCKECFETYTAFTIVYMEMDQQVEVPDWFRCKTCHAYGEYDDRGNITHKNTKGL